MKITVLLWSTSVAKDSSIVPSLFFSHFLGLLFFMAFLFSSSYFWAFSLFYGLSLFILFLTWDNALEKDDHHTSIYLQLNEYNSILEHNMTLCECLRWCTGMCNESRVTCMKEIWTVALPQIRGQLHDHAKQYDNDEACHNKRNNEKLHGNISRNG